MRASLEKYASEIAENRITPHIVYDGKKSGLIVDPADESVPVDVLGFGAYQLEDGPFDLESGEREMAFIPIDGQFRLTTGSKTFTTSREGGHFASRPEKSNISAVYVPPDSTIHIERKGETVFFSAPASPR